MKHRIMAFIPEHKENKLLYTQCDICKKNNNDGCQFSGTELSFDDVDYICYDTSQGKRYNYDICHSCFRDKVIPMLESIGAEPEVEEVGC